MTNVTPPTITLQPLHDPAGEMSEEALALCRDVEALGFDKCGAWTVAEFMDLPLVGFVRPSDGVLAVVYEHPLAGEWMDFCVAYESGGSLTVTSAPKGGELDQRPGHAKHFTAGVSPAGMLALCKAEQLDKPVLQVAAGDFAATFMRMYAEDAAWRNHRGVSAEEVSRVAANMDEPVSDYAVHRTARRYVPPAMDADEAWESLRTWPEFAEDEEISEELFERFENMADFFISNNDPACLPAFLGCLRRDDEDEGLAMFVEEVFQAHALDDVVPVLVQSLGHGDPSVRTWAASFAPSFPDQRLTPAFEALMRQVEPLEGAFKFALMALEEIVRHTGDLAAAGLLQSAVGRCAAMAADFMAAGDYMTAFLILLSVRGHLDAAREEFYARVREAAMEAGFPVEDMEGVIDAAQGLIGRYSE